MVAAGSTGKEGRHLQVKQHACWWGLAMLQGRTRAVVEERKANVGINFSMQSIFGKNSLGFKLQSMKRPEILTIESQDWSFENTEYSWYTHC